MAGTGREAAFSLFEVTMAVALCGLLSASLLPGWLRVWSHLALADTSLVVLNHLRWAQAAAQETGTYSFVRFDMYDPAYQTYVGTQRVDADAFAAGVDYEDHYLQLGTATILYDVLGNAQVGGSIRLCAGDEEQDVRLYIGSGLQSLAGLLP